MSLCTDIQRQTERQNKQERVLGWSKNLEQWVEDLLMLKHSPYNVENQLINQATDESKTHSINLSIHQEPRAVPSDYFCVD